MEYTPKDFGYRTDNPGEDYCRRKQKNARDYRDQNGTDGLHGKMAGGAVTAHMGIFAPMYIRASLLKTMEGANEEHYYRKVGDLKYDSLAQKVRDHGWNQEHAIMVRVNHEGVPCIIEGNTRSTVARDFGIKDVKVQFEWMNGGENARDDLWSPKRVAALCAPSPRKKMNEDEEIEADTYKPIRMKTPKVLYRSVSMAELRDIVRTNRIKGGQNRFNDFDGRRYVFFGDQLNDRLIYQGEETERQAHQALSQHVIHRQFKNLTERAKEEGVFALAMLDQAGIEVPDNYRGALESGQNTGLYLARRANEIRDEGTRHRVLNAMRKIKEIYSEVEMLQNRFRKLYDAENQMIATRRRDQHYTSAILVTKPLKGGIHYSKRHGEGSVSGMGDDDEYGFRPNDLTLEDISEVLLVSHGTVGEALSVEEIERQINDISDLKKGN